MQGGGLQASHRHQECQSSTSLTLGSSRLQRRTPGSLIIAACCCSELELSLCLGLDNIPSTPQMTWPLLLSTDSSFHGIVFLFHGMDSTQWSFWGLSKSTECRSTQSSHPWATKTEAAKCLPYYPNDLCCGIPKELLADVTPLTGVITAHPSFKAVYVTWSPSLSPSQTWGNLEHNPLFAPLPPNSFLLFTLN